MSDDEYDPESRVTPERIAASVIVAGLIITGFVLGGYILALRVFLLFMIPLTMIWIPDILVRTATFDDKWNRQLEAPGSQFTVRLIAWVVILGVPLAWFVFSSIRV